MSHDGGTREQSMSSADSSPELAGQVAVVTGASGGIGRATALELAAAGADVFLQARISPLTGIESVVRAAGVEAVAGWFDLADPVAVEQLAQAAWDWKGAVDIWVNNAGVDVLTGAGAKLSFEEKLEALWQVDVTATMRLSRSIGAKMKARGSGVILNIGWDQAELGMAGDSGELFAATKGAVMAFTRSLAMSLAPEVRVNCIAPGWIKTAWGENASDAWQERAVRESLRERWGRPEDVAAMACFLASPAADFITGQVIHVNGGWRRGK
jgi:3-oxoacyl-[acyl-carrier protein] reductase